MRARARQVDELVQRNLPVFDQDHAVGQGHGLLHVMGHQKRGEAAGLPQAFDQAVHLDAGQRIERAQGFVEQQQARVVHQGTRQGHALALAARQACRPFAQPVTQAHTGQHVGGSAAALGRQAQCHVVGHALPGQEARVLEHDARVLAQAVHGLAVEADGATRDRFEARHQAQQRALAAAAAAHDGHELAGLDHQLGLLEHLAGAVALVHAAHFQAHAVVAAVARCHVGLCHGVRLPA